jgi:hypothetical protein
MSDGIVGVGGGIVATRSRRSRSPRAVTDKFSRAPSGALTLASTPKEERPVGLLGSVLRREAAIAAMKAAVQIAPPPPGRDRSKLVRELGETMQEFRESTVDAIELLASRAPTAARFYWNGMDLALKMLSDLQWGPFPQIADPLLWKWFGHWQTVWLPKGAAPPAWLHNLAVRGGAHSELAMRCRRAEKLLLKLAAGASQEGAGMGGWATMDAGQRVGTLLRVQRHRLSAEHADGGANHAQRRRYGNMELLLYGQGGVHLEHLLELEERTSSVRVNAAMIVQRRWRVHRTTRTMKRAMKRRQSSLTAPPHTGDIVPEIVDDDDELQPLDGRGGPAGTSIDRSYLRQVSVGLPADLS